MFNKHKHKHKTAGQSVNTGSQTAPSGNKLAVNARVDEKLAESVRKFPVLYDKSSKDFKDKHKKERAWQDVVKEVFLIGLDFRTGSTFE